MTSDILALLTAGLFTLPSGGILTLLAAATFIITVGGVLITFSVHLIPVGGAPAAMAQATGIGTGTTQLAAGAGLTGLLTAGAVSVVTDSLFYPLILGAVVSALMVALIMYISDLVYVYGVGCPLSSGKLSRDPFTGDRQDTYVSKGTEGHGIPTVCFASGLAGGLTGGFGGSLIYLALLAAAQTGLTFMTAASLAAVLSIALFYTNAVIASYNIGGTIEGFHDPKMKKLPRGLAASAVMSVLCGFFAVLTVLMFGGVTI